MSYFSFEPFCGMVYMKDLLLLLAKSSTYSVDSEFLRSLSCPLPYN